MTASAPPRGMASCSMAAAPPMARSTTWIGCRRRIPTLPLPVYARVTNLENGRSIVVRINDRGPYANDRIIDLSRRSAELLGFRDNGTAQVRVQISRPGAAERRRQLRAAIPRQSKLHAGRQGKSSKASRCGEKTCRPKDRRTCSAVEAGRPRRGCARTDSKRQPPTWQDARDEGDDKTGPRPHMAGSRRRESAAERLPPAPSRRAKPGDGVDLRWPRDPGRFVQEQGQRRQSAHELAAIAPVDVARSRSGADTYFRVRDRPFSTDQMERNRRLARANEAGYSGAKLISEKLGRRARGCYFAPSSLDSG